MPYVKINPGTGFDKAKKKMGEFFSDMDKGFGFETGGFNPRVDIISKEVNISVVAELPGVAKEDLNISVNEDKTLKISGIKKNAVVESSSYILSERQEGSFERSIHLPEEIDIDNIKADFEEGILTLNIPKVEPEEPKEVKIDIG